MRKVTVKASSDVALIKYWGKKDEALRLPENGSVSVVLDGLDTITTVEFLPEIEKDDVTIQGEAEKGEVDRVSKQLDRIRNVATEAGLTEEAKLFAKVVSQNTFPKGTGLSSSGSGFAALTIAATRAIGLDLSEKELSILARQGSGTACRCVCGGFVEWHDGTTSETSFSETIYPADHWPIVDVIAVVDEGKKKVSSTVGHATATTSPFFEVRQQKIGQKIEKMRQFLQQKKFTQFGELLESEALEFHAILLTSAPALLAWYPGTIEVMQTVTALRAQQIPAYFTINTGFNVHVLTLPEYQDRVVATLMKLSLVKKVLCATPGQAPEELTTHLF